MARKVKLWKRMCKIFLICPGLKEQIHKKIHQFYEQLWYNVQSLETMGKLGDVRGNVALTIDKLGSWDSRRFGPQRRRLAKLGFCQTLWRIGLLDTSKSSGIKWRSSRWNATIETWSNSSEKLCNATNTCVRVLWGPHAQRSRVSSRDIFWWKEKHLGDKEALFQLHRTKTPSNRV